MNVLLWEVWVLPMTYCFLSFLKYTFLLEGSVLVTVFFGLKDHLHLGIWKS